MYRAVIIKNRFADLLIFIPLFIFALCAPLDAATDQENCQLCHQYPLLGTIDDNGSLRSFYVSNEHYASSVHMAIRCSECHRGITKIPHEKNTVIDCSAECHIIEPTTGRPFTHKGTEDVLNSSIHNLNNEFVRNVIKEDFPECVSCHVNEKLSLRLESKKGMEALVMQQAKGRCQECHLNRYDYIDKGVVHILRRTEAVKSQSELEGMCSKCHNDAQLNERHKMINAVYSYRENYHGKTMLLGLETAPSCLSCHIKQGDSPHKILSVKDSGSSTFPDFRGKMCSRTDCHPTASLGMGRSSIHYVLDMHKFPVQFWLMAFFTFLTVLSFVPLMVILIMELLRIIFPKFVLFKRRQK